MDKQGFTDRDRRRLREIRRIWYRMHDTDKGLCRLKNYGWSFFVLVLLIFVPILFFATNLPPKDPLPGMFMLGGFVILLPPLVWLARWHKKIVERIASEFKEAYGEEWERLEKAQNEADKDNSERDIF